MKTILTSLALGLCLALPLSSPLMAGTPGSADATAGAAHAAFPDITQADLAALVASKKVTLIDCNGSDSYARGHIPGAVDAEALGKDLAKALPTDKAAVVVAYCGGPSCGAWQEGAEAAKTLGYTDVRHFAGGISGWKKAGAALATPTK